MNPRVIPVIALLAVIAACACYFLWSDPSPTIVTADADSQHPHNDSASEKNSASGNAPGAAKKKPAVNWKRFAAMMAGADGAEGAVPKPTPEDIARFLAKCGETAVNLVAAYGATHDRRLLERALALFPNSPIVLMSAIESIPAGAAPKPGEAYQPDAGRLAFIERFKSADPNNPLPWIYSAGELFKAGQTGDAVAELRAALERPAFYTYTNERMDGAQRLYEDMGISSVEASLLATFGLTMPQMSAAQQVSRSLTDWQKSAADSGDAAAADDALRLTYDLGRTFATPEASRFLIGQLVGFNMEARALKALPADAQPGWLSVSPAQRLAEMEMQKQNVRSLTANVDWLLQQQDEPLLTEYLRRNREDGELSALTWLKAQRK
jgi:hypothetical protein